MNGHNWGKYVLNYTESKLGTVSGMNLSVVMDVKMNDNKHLDRFLNHMKLEYLLMPWWVFFQTFYI